MANIEARNRTRVGIDVDAIAAYAKAALEADREFSDREVALTFIGDRAMQELNEKYRGKGQPTDVLSFGMDEDDEFEASPLGDIVIAPRQAMADAKEEGVSFDEKLRELTLHGLLHLMGHDHETPSDAAKMEKRRKKIIAAMERGGRRR